jgi:rhamnosyltransferase
MKVLVLLAAFNGEKFIRKQIESILQQKNVLVTIMVFDDVSTDQTIKEVEFFRDDARVILVKNNIGTGSAANNFFNAIKTLSEIIINKYDFIAFSDQDDIWLPHKLEAAKNMLLKENSSLYCSNLILWNEETNKKSIINKSFAQKKYDFLFEGGSAGCTYVLTNQFCCEVKIIVNQTNYIDWKFFSHDWFIYFFARLNNYKVSIDSNAYILYRIHANNSYGHLNMNTISSFRAKFNLIKQGWFQEQIKGFSKLLPEDSIELNIYKLYSLNYFTRMFVIIRYNFSLFRSIKKYLLFFNVNLVLINSKKKHV